MNRMDLQQRALGFLYGAFLEMFLSAAVSLRMLQTMSIYNWLDYFSLFCCIVCLATMCCFIGLVTYLNLTATKEISTYYLNERITT